MLWFILCVAVLNIAAGFGLAVYLAGYSAGDEGFSPDCSAGDSIDEATPADFSMPFPEAPDTPEATGTPALAPSREEPAMDQTSEPDVPQPLPDPIDSADNSVMADLDAAVSLALGDVTLPESTNVEPSQTQEEPLVAYQSQLETFCDELIAFDARLRETPPEETTELKSQLDSVTESSQKQNAAREDVEQSLRDMISAETIGEKQGRAMIAAIQEERQEAADMTEAFEHIDPETDPATQCGMVLDRTASLLNANHSLRDDVSNMISTLPSLNGENGSNASVDPLTGIMSRTALDATLDEHWKKDPHRARAVSLTVIDLDHFAKLNRNHGPALGDRVLRAIAQLLESDSPTDCCVARFAGQRFALLSFDRDLKQIVGDTERMRQTIEMVRLEHGERDLEITVSCGVVAAIPDDTHETLYARAIESVQEAKRYGRNRSFVHEGEYPTPVVPPNFALNEKHVSL